MDDLFRDQTRNAAVNGLRFLAAKLEQCEKVEDFVFLSSRDPYAVTEERYGKPYGSLAPCDNLVSVKLEITFRPGERRAS